MGPPVDPVEADAAPPPRADVVIIGGGIIGTCTALFLAEQGISVALCEKGGIAGEQSSRNWGWVRKTARDPREIPLIIESLRLWQDMNRLTEAETGFRQPGIMYLAESQAEIGQFEAWLEHARPDLYGQIHDADRESARHFGRGSALAQVYGHCIMPLAGPRDQQTQVRWGIADFVHRFQPGILARRLVEMAVHTDETLIPRNGHGMELYGVG